MGSREDNLPSARWRRLVEGRLGEIERLTPGACSLSGSFWDRRADRFAANVRANETEKDPFLRRLRRVADPSATVLDVGAGTGRFALPLSACVAQVTAVDPSRAMLDNLRRGAEELGVDNLTTIQSTWDEADAPAADIVFSAFVLTLVPDALGFLQKMEATARRHVFLYLGAYSADALLDPLWRHFHDEPRLPGPTYLDALAVLGELGIAPQVKLVELRNRKRFETVEEAVENYREWLLLDDTPEVRGELAGLLSMWLLGRRGAYRSPLRSLPAAIITWAP